MTGIVVIAIGNEYRQDDGAAPAALRLLCEEGAHADHFEHTDGEATRLLALWQGRDLAVVIDAVHDHPGEPGRIHRLDLARAALLRGGANTHGLGLGEAVELGRVLDLLPGRLVVVGIEGECFDWGDGLSPAVTEAVPKAAAVVRELLLTQAAAPPLLADAAAEGASGALQGLADPAPARHHGTHAAGGGETGGAARWREPDPASAPRRHEPGAGQPEPLQWWP